MAERPLLALDPATTTGWAYGLPGEEPTFGSIGFGGPGVCNGEVIGKFRAWLLETCYRIKPRAVCFESPYVPRPKKNPKPGEKDVINPLTLRRLYAIAGEIEAVAWQLRIECLEATTGEICKYFTGTQYHGGRDQKKAAIMARARQYGWDVRDTDAADAVALWAMAENIFDPVASSRRGDGDLSLPLPEPVVIKRKPRKSSKPARPQAPVQEPLFV